MYVCTRVYICVCLIKYDKIFVFFYKNIIILVCHIK